MEKGFEKYFKKISSFADKIGKQNFVLIIFLLLVVVITGLYQTFSLYTGSSGVSVVDGLKTYKFILTSNTENMVTVAANSSKNLMITIDNSEEMKLQYGLYYTSSSDLSEVTIYYLNSSKYPAQGLIESASTYTIKVKINNSSDEDIDVAFGTKYGFADGGELVYEDGQYLVASEPPTAIKYIQGLYLDGSNMTIVNIGGDPEKSTVSLNSNQKIMLDNNGEYRYYGANPDNYIVFNDELWRMIGVSKVKTSSQDSTNEMLVKIIRDDSIGSYSYDSSSSSINAGYGVNDWAKADLMTELNTLYYNQEVGTCYNGINNALTSCDFSIVGLNLEARDRLADVVWSLGGISEYSELYAHDYYHLERGTLEYDCSANDGVCPRSTSWMGKIALMYPSDYAYAADLSLCKNSLFQYQNDSNCLDSNWLFNSYSNQWTLSPSSSFGSNAFIIDLDGSVIEQYTDLASTVRPVAFLRADVTIISGNGTKSNPYRLG